MRSVPRRGSGWVSGLPIVDWQLPIEARVKTNWQLAIANRQSPATTEHDPQQPLSGRVGHRPSESRAARSRLDAKGAAARVRADRWFGPRGATAACVHD